MDYLERKEFNEKIREELDRILSDQSLEFSTDETEALDDLKHLINDDSNGVLDYFKPASTLVAEHERWARVALLSARVMLKDDPDNIFYLQFCGKMYIQNGRYNEAVELLEGAIERNEGTLQSEGELANFYALLGLATLENGSARGAIPYATKALGLCVANHVDEGRLFTTFTELAEGANTKNAEDVSIAMGVLKRASLLRQKRVHGNDGALG